MHQSFPALRHPRYRTLLTCLAVLLIACVYCWPTLEQNLQKWNVNEVPSWVGALPGEARPGEKLCDVDTRLIHIGFLQAPHFKDTTRWLTGIWVGQVPFYRPLTSYVFWAQWKLWGNHEARYNCVAVLLHLMAVFAFARLACKLLAQYRLPLPYLGTLVTGLLFVDGFGILQSQPTIVGETYANWKNEPDALTLLFFSLGLAAYLKRPHRSEARWWQKIAPTGWYLLLCLTKEAGVFLPLLLPIVEAPELLDRKTRRAALRRLLPFAVVLPLYLGLRAVFLHDAIGYRYGSNTSWLFRLGGNLAGDFSESIALHNYTAIAVTTFVTFCAVYIWWLKRRGGLKQFRTMRLVEAGLLAAIPLGVLLSIALVLSWLQPTPTGELDLVVTLLLFGAYDYVHRAIMASIFLLCLWRAFWLRPNFAVLCYAWALFTLALTLFSPSVLHRYYLMNAGFAVLIAGGAMLWIAPLVDAWARGVQQRRSVKQVQA